MGLGLFALIGSVVVASFCAIVFLPDVWMKFGASLIYGAFIAILFVIGHDACHGALTPSAPLNQWLTRLAFLPTLHPASPWEFGHNQLHHGWTNLKGVDYGYTPFTLEEFRALPAWRRGVERFFRTPLGMPFFYMHIVWWRHLIWPRPADLRKLHKGWLVFDLGLVAAFFMAELTLSGWIGWQQGGRSGAVVNMLLAVIWPFLIWNWIMAFVTVQHHTHPRVAWFDSREEWTVFSGQFESTVHVRMPRWLEVLYHDIFEHNAHHVDPKIPLYNLHASQRELELAYPNSVTIIHTSLPALSATLRACKLYDYRQHRWTDFEGRPTGDRILIPKTRAVGSVVRVEESV